MAQEIKIATVLAAVLLLAGCNGNQNVRDIDIQEVKVPFLYCPPPPRVQRPTLVIEQLSPADQTDPGKVAQAYKASFIQLRGYTENLEQILQQYNATSSEFEDLRKQMRELYPDADIEQLEREAVPPPTQ